MRNPATGNLALAGYNDIFNVGTLQNNGAQIMEIALAELHAPEFHPFQVNDDEAMKSLVESITKFGVREPGLARKRDDGGLVGRSASCSPLHPGYELLAGNRRKRACELAGLPTLPVIIYEMNDDEAAIAMVDSNLQQREKLLPSEKAWAYRVKMAALKHSGIKAERHSFDIMTEQTGESKNQIYRLIRLTELIPDLMDKVDTRKLAFNPAVELSYLSRTEQIAVVEAMEEHEVKPSLSQAVRLKKLSQSGELSTETISEILSEVKKLPKSEQTESIGYRRFFPRDYSSEQIDAVIMGLLRDWQIEQRGLSC